MASAVLGKRRRGPEIVNETSLGHGIRTKRRGNIRVLEATTFEFPVAQDEDHLQLDASYYGKDKHPLGKISDKVVAEQSPDSLDCITAIYNDENVAPHIPTPKTPRHRDALSKKTPVTPRHRVIIGGRPFTPRTPRTPTTSSASGTVYNDARKVFTRNADPGALVGRDTERMELESFITGCTEAGKGDCLYVSGPPGTGKSALVTDICRGYGENEAVRYAYVNCMSIKNATDIYSLTTSELGLSDDVFHAGAKEILQTALLDKGQQQMLLVVLDEIDSLLNQDTDVLYNLFEWSFARTTKLVLIGIANALDLTDRFLPRLKARNMKPTLLPFLPYTAAETASVLTARSRSLLLHGTSAAADYTPFLHPAAIQLISKKVASQTGDLRKAFDIAQRAIDLVEAETKEKFAREAAAEQQKSPTSPSRTPLGENINLSSPSAMSTDSPISTPRPSRSAASLLRQLTAETAPRATLAHVVRVTSAAFNNGATQRLKALTLQQKAVLCSLVSLEQKRQRAATSLPSPPTPSVDKRRKGLLATPTKRGSGSPNTAAAVMAPTMRALFDTYTLLCKRDNVLHALSSTEFRDVVANLETLSLVGAVEGTGKGGLSFTATTPSKRGKGACGSGLTGAVMELTKVRAFVGVADLGVAVEGVGSGILKTILSGEGLDS